MFQNNETAAMLVYPENPLGVELFSLLNVFFCSNKLAKMLATWVKTFYRNSACGEWKLIWQRRAEASEDPCAKNGVWHMNKFSFTVHISHKNKKFHVRFIITNYFGQFLSALFQWHLCRLAIFKTEYCVVCCLCSEGLSTIVWVFVSEAKQTRTQ